MKRTLLVLIVLFGLVGAVARAQDSATPVGPAPTAIVIPPSDGTVVLPGTVTTPPIVIEPAASFNPLVLVVGAVLLLVVGFLLAVTRGASPDTAAVDQVETLRHNEVVIAEIRGAYESRDAVFHSALEGAMTLLKTFAPLTPLKIDDELVLLLNDITDKTAAKAALQQVKAQEQVKAMLDTPIHSVASPSSGMAESVRDQIENAKFSGPYGP